MCSAITLLGAVRRHLRPSVQRGAPHFALSLPRPSLPVSPPLPPFFFLFSPLPSLLVLLRILFFFFFLFLPAAFSPAPFLAAGGKSPCRRKGGSVSIFFFFLGCVCVCVAAARACGARVGERGRSPARLKEPWMARRGDMDSGKSGGLDHSETGRDAPGPG